MSDLTMTEGAGFWDRLILQQRSSTAERIQRIRGTGGGWNTVRMQWAFELGVGAKTILVMSGHRLFASRACSCAALIILAAITSF